MAAELHLDAADYRAMVDDSQAVQHESIDEVYSEHSMWFADVEERADDGGEEERRRPSRRDRGSTLARTHHVHDRDGRHEATIRAGLRRWPRRRSSSSSS